MDWPGVTDVVSPLQIELILIGQVEMLVGKTNYPILSLVIWASTGMNKSSSNQIWINVMADCI